MKCDNCTFKDINMGLTKPYYSGKLLFLLDHPTLPDLDIGVISSGLSNRNSSIDALLKHSKVKRDNISISSVIQCVTKNKSNFSIIEYENCLDIDLSKINSILCFGDIPAKTIIGTSKFNKINDVRNETFYYNNIPVRMTYSLDILNNSGCCGAKTKKQLMIKDVINAYDLSNNIT